ncbi:hypothetical protein PG614_10415 [Riemerella anatipestifer]|uniref:hypothetical protein n=1 Tax=Riemerella anatipestifer TaxID=34085 RepID=UPI001374FE78|nr:hypothetical protein [Riemerella anatipestifer]MDY3534302.1 hypothetical protein [Riemerella anatipestifer]MDY3536355.1 hypothetical protein [Riemerella anatipestifer]
MSKELQDAFRELAKRDVDTFPVQVISVDKTAGTCTVSDGEIEFTDVRLSATIDNETKRFYLYPKVGSFVLVSPIEEDINRLYVEFFSEVEEFDFKTENSQIKINDEGFLLRKENETLKALMVDLIQEIKKMKFTTNAGPTIRLINKPQFTAIENRFKNFLKDN